MIPLNTIIVDFNSRFEKYRTIQNGFLVDYHEGDTLPADTSGAWLRMEENPLDPSPTRWIKYDYSNSDANMGYADHSQGRIAVQQRKHYDPNGKLPDKAWWQLSRINACHYNGALALAIQIAIDSSGVSVDSGGSYFVYF
jgi:hypothetical protein